MICDNCDRNNIVRAYCYFSQNTVLFEELRGVRFSYESFSDYALEMQLKCAIDLCCISKSRGELRQYWNALRPYYIEAVAKFDVARTTSP
jgi:hypothetical protein